MASRISFPIFLLAFLISGCASETRTSSSAPSDHPVPAVVAPQTADAEGLNTESGALDDSSGNLIILTDAKTVERLGYRLGDKMTVRLGLKAVPVRFARGLAEVPVNQDLLFVDEKGRTNLATNHGNFGEKHHLHPPVRLFIPRKGTRK